LQRQNGREISWRRPTNGGNETHSGASNETTDNHHSKGRGGGLKDTTNDEGQAARDNCPSTTNAVGDVSSNNGTKERSTRENPSKKRLLPSWKHKEIELVRAGIWSRVWSSRILVNIVLHSHDSSHPSRVVSEEDTTKCSESAHEVGLQGNGSFDTRGIGRTMDHTSSSHDEVMQECLSEEEGEMVRYPSSR